jgi:hypothetical protein
MRNLFVVVAKLFGLVQVYSALTSLGIAVGFATQVAGAEPTHIGQQVIINVTIISFYSILSFGLAWLLLCRTEWLADRLAIQCDGTRVEMTGADILHVGTKLIGIFVIVRALPDLVRVLIESRIWTQGEVLGLYTWSKVVSSVLEVTLGLVLVLKTRTILTWVGGNGRPLEK